MLYQQSPDEEVNLIRGMVAVRKIHRRVLTETGLTTADEMLYPENFELVSDLVSYHAVGARSVENQQHRFVASGIDAPVGLKNPTSGNETGAINPATIEITIGNKILAVCETSPARYDIRIFRSCLVVTALMATG